MLVSLVPIGFFGELFFEILNLPLVHSFSGFLPEYTGVRVDEFEVNNFLYFLCNGFEFSDSLGLLLDVDFHIGVHFLRVGIAIAYGLVLVWHAGGGLPHG